MRGGGGALGWAAKAGTTIPSSRLLVASPILCLPLLFSYSFQTPQSAFYYLSAIQVFSLIPPPYILGRRLFVQFFSLYNLLSNYHHLLLLYREIALSISFFLFFFFFHMCHFKMYIEMYYVFNVIGLYCPPTYLAHFLYFIEYTKTAYPAMDTSGMFMDPFAASSFFNKRDIHLFSHL